MVMLVVVAVVLMLAPKRRVTVSDAAEGIHLEGRVEDALGWHGHRGRRQGEQVRLSAPQCLLGHAVEVEEVQRSLPGHGDGGPPEEWHGAPCRALRHTRLCSGMDRLWSSCRVQQSKRERERETERERERELLKNI